jgi:hypothetical protein
MRVAAGACNDGSSYLDGGIEMVRYYLKISDVRGSSTGPYHIGWIDVHTWTLVGNDSISCEIPKTDISVPQLRVACARGDIFDSAVLEVIDRGQKKMRLDMTKVFVEKFTPSNSGIVLKLNSATMISTYAMKPPVQQRFMEAKEMLGV